MASHRRGADGHYTMLAIAILLLLPLLYFVRWFPFTREIDPGEHFAFYATRTLTASYILKGIPPLWNPLSLCGTPLAADVISSAFYPLNAPYLALPPVVAANLILFLHYGLAGVFFFAYVRSLGVSRTAGLYGSIVYAFSGFLVAHRGHTSFQNAVIWFPLIALALTKNIHELRWGFIAIGSIALAMVVVCDFLPIPYILLFALMLLAFSLFWRSGGALFPRALISFPIILGLGFLLGGIQLVPSFEFARNSVRAQIAYSEFVKYSFHPFLLPLLIFPNAMGTEAPTIFGQGYWGPWNLTEIGSGFCGIAPLAIAVIAVMLLRKSNRTVLFHALAAMASLFLVFGTYNPLYRIMYHVPVYNLFRVPCRNWIIYNLAVAVLVSFGLDALRGRWSDHSRARVMRCTGMVIAGILCIMAASVFFLALFPSLIRCPAMGGKMVLIEEMSPRLRICMDGITLRANAFLFPLCVMAATVVLLQLLRRGYGTAAVACLFAVTWIDLFSFGSLHCARDFRLDYLFIPSAYPPAVRYLIAHGADSPSIRVLPFRPVQRFGTTSLYAQNNLFYRIPSFTGYGPLIIGRYAKLTGTDCAGLTPQATLENRPLLSMLNVKYILCPQHAASLVSSLAAPSGEPLYTKVWEDARETLFENPSCLPRAWLVNRARAVRWFSDTTQVIMGTDPGFDPSVEALVEAERLPARLGPLRGTATITRYTPNRIEIRCASPSPNLLVLSEIFYPGWRALVDGRQERIYAVNGVLRGVFVPEGEHMVQFYYRPKSFMLGLACSGLGATLIASLCMFGIFTRKGQRI